MKCKWYVDFESVCTNGECPYRGDVCPTSEYPEVCKYADATQETEWISVKDEDGLPKNEQEVLIYCNRDGFKFVCPAIYEDGTMLTQNSCWNWYDIEEYGTYSEENDDYFVRKGWWENRQFTPDDVYNCPVDCEVTHWMPLPKPPKEETRD